MLPATPLLTRLTAAAVPAAPPMRNAKPVAVMVIGDHPDAADILTPARQGGLQAMTDALARFRPTVVAFEWAAAVVAERFARLASAPPPSRSELALRLARQTGARIVGVGRPGEAPCGPGLWETLTEAVRPGDRMVVFHDSAALRRRVMTTPGLKLVEASAWLAL